MQAIRQYYEDAPESVAIPCDTGIHAPPTVGGNHAIAGCAVKPVYGWAESFAVLHAQRWR